MEITSKESVFVNRDGKELNVRSDRPIVKCQIAIPKENVSMGHVTVKQGLKGHTVKSKIVSIQLVPIVVSVFKENAFVNQDFAELTVQVQMIVCLNFSLIVPSMESMMLTLPNVLASMATLVIIVPLVSTSIFPVKLLSTLPNFYSFHRVPLSYC